MARFNTAATVASAWSEDPSGQDPGKMVAQETLADDLDMPSSDTAQDAFVDELKPGSKLLQGQYTIVSFLNSGGFGITYLAKDSLDRTIVIKECFPNSLCRRSGVIVRARSRAHQGEFRSVVRLFVQEARSLSKLIHPNIVGVHQVFEDNDTAYMAIDYINGKDLLDLLDESDSPFTPAETVQMLKKVLGAVDFVHQSGMLHRDISPDNILIDSRTKTPILIDFGAAREQATKASRVMSQRRVVKDGYSPQEFYLSGSAQGPYSDLYALAATFYHVITGIAPPESQRRLASIAEGSPDPYEPLAGHYEGYPPGFLESIDKAVRVLPKDRLETASQWLDIIIAGETGAVADAPAAPPVAVTPTRFARKIITAPQPDAVPSAAAQLPVFAARTRFPLLLGASSVLALGLGYAIWTYGSTTPDAAPVALAPASTAPETAVPAAVLPTPVIAVAEPAAPAIAAPAIEAPATAPVVAPAVAVAEPKSPVPAASEAAALAFAEATANADAAAKARAVTDAKATDEAASRARAAADAKAKADAKAAAEAKAAAKAAAEMQAVAAAQAAAQAEAAAKAAAEAEAAAKAAAVAKAAAEVEAAARAAAVVPRPPATATPLLEDQFASVHWDYALPFVADVKLIDGETFPSITSVTPVAGSDRANAWVSEGVTIYAINGEWVSDVDAIQKLIRVSTTPDDAGMISATARIRTTEGSAFEEVTLTAPATRWVDLKNGITFRTEAVNGEWRTLVDHITYSDTDGLLPGDVVLSEATLDKKIDAPESLEVVIDLLSFQNVGEAAFKVLRDGETLSARMPLERE